MSVYEGLIYALHALLGGILWLLVHWKWNRKQVIQHTLVPLICGYIYYLLHVEHGCPDTLATIFVGYLSMDFINSFSERLFKLLVG